MCSLGLFSDFLQNREKDGLVGYKCDIFISNVAIFPPILFLTWKLDSIDSIIIGDDDANM